MKNNQTALITGAAKRIGREIALNLAQKGYDIVIAYNNSKKEAQNLAQKIKKDFKVNCEIFAADLFDLNQAKKLAKFMINDFPSWNLLINNASIFNQSKFLTAPEYELVNNMNIHLNSPLILAKEFALNIKKKNIENAQIINMVDKNIRRFDTSYFYYLLSKKFLSEFTKMLSLELAPKIRVNGVAPGFILSEEKVEIRVKNLDQKIPLKKQGEVKNILQAINFLLENKFITGQIIFVVGGASLNHAG